ncbi:crossover junction endonuclease MUS81 [Venturia canescens]|uniref:crossover junction endonuclease MUS81 n=1 Tax=Venturia canescens TaxID=32260 RepID=UPI001C9D29CE|nr:crossover junction endonuclease MUS81 [Venturia canescens]XP_043282297.1 crossover junction endonuclease MUS81 [Venturia canescens]XP_043282298.1 crossover junction endonuclease MUS81 [Venturia canescens]
MKKTKVNTKCANPLFEKWLIEWRNEAKAKGSCLEKHFTKAIVSLRKYPLVLNSGRDCILLQHFGTKLCAMLDKKLIAHNEADRVNHGGLIAKNSKSPVKKIFPTDQTHLQKTSCAQRIQQAAGSNPRGRIHSAPSSEANVPARVAEGHKNEDIVLVKKLENERENANTFKDKFSLMPNDFDIILLVDIRETGNGKPKSKDDVTKSELDRLAVPYEIRHLKIGDFAWVARCRETGRELILPYILERKRMDDLASSIKDGRFHEQKFRLKQSGIPNLIYMVESHGNNQNIGIPLPTLLQASTNSLVQDGFTLKFTKNHKDSMRYLSILTSLIYKIFKKKHLTSGAKEDLQTVSISRTRITLMEFNQFNKAASKVKTFKVKEMFIRQLLQLKGLSLEKVLAIVERYPTPLSLKKAVESVESDEGVKLLTTIKIASQSRQLGLVLGQTVHHLYTKRQFD